MSTKCRFRFLAAALFLGLSWQLVAQSSAAVAPEGGMKTQDFDTDPGWEGSRNLATPGRVPMVTQDFGYSESNFAGRAKGEIGGSVWRSTTPAFYAAKIPTRTLNDKLN